MKSGILLYIDPGTGAMLFTVIISIVTTLMFTAQKIWLKIKFVISGGKSSAQNTVRMNIVIFSDSKRYWNVYKPICAEFENRHIECHYWTASPDDPALDQKYEFVKCEFIGEGNKAYARLNMMGADVCLSTTPGLDVYQWKYSKNVGCYVHIPHEVGEMTGYRMFGIDYYDAILLTGDFQEKDIRKIEELRGLKNKEVLVVGSSYMDDLLEKLNHSSQAAKKDNITVLVAPSWGEISILNKYGERFLKQLKETGYRVIVRPHPQSMTSDPELLEKLQREFPNDDNWSWNFDNDNFEVLNSADIMISDFSGVIFDFTLVFDKPVIYADTHMDRSPYDSCWLDEEPWRLQILSKIGRQLIEEDFANLKIIIEETLRSETYDEGRTEVRDIAWKYPGESAKRVVDYLMMKQNQMARNR